MAGHLVHLVQGLATGGLERVALELSRAMKRAGWAVTICCYDHLGDWAAAAREAGVAVELLPRRPGVDWGYIRTLAKKLSHWRADLLHMHNSTALFYGTLAARRAQTRGAVYTEHAATFSHGPIASWFHRRLVKRLSQAVTVSETVKQRWCRYDGLKPDSVQVIYNGVPAPPPAGASREPSKGPRIAYVGRLSREKGADLLLEAFAAVRRAIPASELVLIGDGAERPALEKRAAEIGGVHFAGWQQDVPAWLATMDLFALPSRTEGLPLALLEAMAAGLPAVAADVGGVHEALDNGTTGLLVDPENPARLAEAMLALAQDPARRSGMGRSARQRFENRFALDRMVASYSALYDRILRT